MGLRKDFSVVADSEMASSPPSKSSPAPIRRAAKTYGRRRDDPDTSFTYSEQDSRDSIYRTGPLDISDEVPPSEPSRLLDSDEEGEDDDGDVLPSSLVLPRFTFGWKEKLKQLDNEEDSNEYPRSQNASEHTSPKEASDLLAHMDTGSDSSALRAGARVLANLARGDVFGESLSSLNSPFQPDASQDCSSPAYAPHGSHDRPRTRKNMIQSDDDMRNDDKQDNRSSSPQTSPLHPIATPKSHLTSSPPTSHHDDVSIDSTESSGSKGKGKTRKPRHSVVPIRFTSREREGFDDLQNAMRPRSSLMRREKKKVKAPTKKERQEFIRERARMAAEQEVSIEKTTIPERSLKTLFSKLGQQKGLPLAAEQRTESTTVQLLTSPIGSSSSSEPQPCGSDETEVSRIPSAQKPIVTRAGECPLPKEQITKDSQLVSEDDSGSNGRSAAGVLNSAGGRKEEEDTVVRKHQLDQLKFRWLSKQKDSDASDDHGLEVVKPTELEQQRKLGEKKMSRGQRMLLIGARAQHKSPSLDPRKTKRQDLAGVREAVLKRGTSNPHLLNLLLRQHAEEESLDIVRQKEREWKRLGGVVREPPENESVEDNQRNQIQKGLEVWTRGEKNSTLADEDENEGDPDWSSESGGSVSPSPEYKVGEDIDYEKMEMGEMDEEVPREQEQGIGEAGSKVSKSEDENEDVPVFKTKGRGRPRSRVVDSDESDSAEYADGNAMLPKPRDPRYIASSSDDRTEDENDKENDTRLMFDRSEDKENKAVVRHGSLAGPSLSLRPIFDDSDRDLSLSPPHVTAPEPEAENGTRSSISSNEKREPLGVLSDANPISLQRQPSGLTQTFAAQLKHASPRGPVEDGDVFAAPSIASLNFAPVFDRDAGKEKKSVLGFSQLSQEGSSSVGFGAPALLQPGFSDLFDSGTQKGDDPAQGLRNQVSLGLTQDLALQPAFQVDEKLLRKADAIFEKEQEYVVEAVSKRGAKDQEFYVNDVGLLTQTRPSVSRLGTRSPSFVLSPTQLRTQQTASSLDFTQTQTEMDRCASDPSPARPRPPLRTLSLSNPQLSSPEISPKRRLRKRAETPTPGSPIRSFTSSNILISTSPRQRLSAFDVLGKAPSTTRDKGKNTETVIGKKVRQEWLVEEAEESDEDQMAGFGFAKKRDEEEDENREGVDWDTMLPELVDDQKMDEETEGADRVLEKHKELLEQDDVAAIKFHQGVVQGELRKKRKNRFGLDDSDEEDEEDDRARRIRRRMKEKVERGDIQELAANEKTAAFANVYQTGLIDEEPIETRPLDLDLDFRLGRELEDEDVMMGNSQGDKEEGQEDAAQAEDEEGDDKNRYVTYQDIRAEVRKINEQPESQMEILDYEDVSWIDKQDDGMEADSVKIQVVTSHRKKPPVGAPTAKPVAEWDSFMVRGGIRRKENEKDLERSRTWAKNETRNITGSTGRVVGGIAVTGHGNKAESGRGSLRSKGSLASASSVSSSKLGGKKPLKPEGSVLAGIAKRKEQFQ